MRNFPSQIQRNIVCLPVRTAKLIGRVIGKMLRKLTLEKERASKEEKGRCG